MAWHLKAFAKPAFPAPPRAIDTATTPMTTAYTLDKAVAWMLNAFDRPADERLAFVEQFRRQPRKCNDALATAECALLDAMVADVRRPLQPMIDKLEQAVWVFRANDRPDRAAACLQWLSSRYCLNGSASEGMVCAQLALAIPELDIDSRLYLANTMVWGLTTLLCFEECLVCLERDFLPFMRTAEDSPRLAFAWRAAAFFHVLGAMRACRLQSIYTMDMDDTVPSCSAQMRLLMQPGLAQAKRCLQSALAVQSAALSSVMEPMRGLIHALEGDADAAVCSFGLEPQEGLAEIGRLSNAGWALRINGRWADALVWLDAGQQLSREVGAALGESLCCYDLAICHAALGDLGAALLAQSRFGILHARTAIQSTRISIKCEHWQVTSVVQVEPEQIQYAAGPGAPQLRRSAPPYVLKAQRLMAQTIANRLSLATVATRVGIGPRSLQVGLADYLGVTFMAAYRHEAMKEAQRLLRLTEIPIGEIACRVGYQSASSFSRDYKDFSGMPPKGYRDASAQRSAVRAGLIDPGKVSSL